MSWRDVSKPYERIDVSKAIEMIDKFSDKWEEARWGPCHHIIADYNLETHWLDEAIPIVEDSIKVLSEMRGLILLLLVLIPDWQGKPISSGLIRIFVDKREKGPLFNDNWGDAHDVFVGRETDRNSLQDAHAWVNRKTTESKEIIDLLWRLKCIPEEERLDEEDS